MLSDNQKSEFKSNYIKYGVVSILHTVALLISSGTIIQAFLLYFGVSSKNVEVYSSITLITQVAMMLVLTLFGDRLKRIKGIIAVCFFVFPIIFISMMLVSTGFVAGQDSVYGVVLIGSIICNLALGVYYIMSYKLPYSIFDVDDFGKITSIIGIISGIVSIGVSFLLSFCVSRFDYRIVMTVSLSIGSLLWIICGALTASYKTRTVAEDNNESSNSLKEFFLSPLFYKSIIPTVLRGVGMGIFGLIVAIGVRDGFLDTEKATIITIFTSLSTIIGYWIYIIIDKRLKHKHTIIVFGVLSGLFIPFMVITQQPVWFYVFYFLSNLAITIIGMAHPVLVYESVSYKHIGSFTAWRMLFMTFGQAIPGFFISGLYEVIGSVGIMMIGAACSVVSSILLGIVLKKDKSVTPDGNRS